MKPVVLSLAALGALVLAACDVDFDPEWQLDHDRVVAVAANPPGIAAGERSELVALIAEKGGPVAELVPEQAIVASPMSLAGALAFDGGSWVVTAPASEEQMIAARTELGLMPGAPVPLVVGVSYGAGTLFATKVVVLGVAVENPQLGAVTVNAAEAPATDLVVGKLVDVPMTVALADPEHQDVNWLTSCGTMHDFDLPQSYLRVEAEDPVEGQLVVVVRDRKTGGVAWRIWSIRAE
ncbi:MAG: hypothetical protein KF773_09980 [Deltaproteobacteria bacterium]|nr:hypothetical protein [Deltaproteobacteria bacterium]